MLCVFGQKYAFFCCRKAAANHKYFLACEKFAVTGRTIGNTMSTEFRFTLKANHSRVCTRRSNDTETLHLAFCSMHGFDIFLWHKTCDFRKKKFCSEFFRLPPHSFRQFRTACNFHTGVIHHLGCDCDLTAEFFFFYYKYSVFCSSKIQGGCQSRRAAADNNSVIQFLITHYS